MVREGILESGQHHHPRTNGTTQDRSALVLYGSETGNAEDVAHEIGRLTERLRFATVILDLNSISLKDLLKYTVVIVAISTTGQGEFPQNARAFWKALLSQRLKPGVLRRMLFATFGLGDSSYPKFNVTHRMLHGRLVQLGANTFCDRGEGNEQHPEGHSADFRVWIVTLKAALEEHFPLYPPQTILPEDHFIEPKWKLVLDEQSSQDLLGDDHVPDVDPSRNAAPDPCPLPVKDGILADITSNDRFTPPEHFQDVRLMDLLLHRETNYSPGAVAVVYPKNFPADVDEFIKSQCWQEVADQPVRLVPNIQDESLLSPSPLRHVDIETTTLRSLLTNYLDILSIPRRSFFASLVYFARTSSEDEQYQKERLLELANPDLIDELWDYTTRPRRTILEVMPDFTSIKIPWQYACTVLPVMRGRQFSISSGGKLKEARDGQTRVQLLVAIADPPNPIIKYRKRHGVCTRYMATLAAGQQISIGLQQGYLGVKPKDYEVPTIMISPGTGVAPMRSLIYDRLHCAENGMFQWMDRPLDGCMLFFGCRSEESDFFFRDEWERLKSYGLEVYLATSRQRDAPRKYVQEVLSEKARVVYEAMVKRQGRIFVCGSSGNMPKAVRQALMEIISSEGQMSEEEATALLERMEKDGRYKQETW